MSVLIAPLSELEEEAFTVSEDELEALVSDAAVDEREVESTRELHLLYAAEAAQSSLTLPILATAGARQAERVSPGAARGSGD